MLQTRAVCIHVICTYMLGKCVCKHICWVYVLVPALWLRLHMFAYVCAHTNVHRYACAILRASLAPQIPLTSLYSQQCYHYSLSLVLPTQSRHIHTVLHCNQWWDKAEIEMQNKALYCGFIHFSCSKGMYYTHLQTLKKIDKFNVKIKMGACYLISVFILSLSNFAGISFFK